MPAGVPGGDPPLGPPPATMRSARRCADLMATFSSGVCMSCKPFSLDTRPYMIQSISRHQAAAFTRDTSVLCRPAEAHDVRCPAAPEGLQFMSRTLEVEPGCVYARPG